MRDYYRRTLIDRWQDLLDLSPNTQRLYFYCFAGPTSTPYGISVLHKGQTRRDLGMTVVGVDAALVELVQAGVAVVDDMGSRFVVADTKLSAAICPNKPNNHRHMVKLVKHIPDGPCRQAWEGTLNWPVSQLPDLTGAAAPRVANVSATGGPQKKEKEKEKKKPTTSRFAPPTESEVSAHMHNKGLSLADADEQGQEFVLFYESKGWLVGKSKMKNWRAAATRWANKRMKDTNKRASKPGADLFATMEDYYG